MSTKSIFVGYDPRETEAFAVCRHSLRRFAPGVPIHALVLDELRDAGLYRRPTSRRDGKLWDVISEAPMATEFACSRFLIKELADTDWAIFMDCDFLARGSLQPLFDRLDTRYAAMVVKHAHIPTAKTKMDGQVQTRYARKNWSSMMAINTRHTANKGLTVELANTVPGRDLHAFCWLQDDEIGALPAGWNFLINHTAADGAEPALVHFTDGTPNMAGYENVPYADEWRSERAMWFSEDAFHQLPIGGTRSVVYSNGVLR
jgi:hypothetical protein